MVPTITPDDRSNSPPIMSSATASALSPYSADVSTYVEVPSHDSHTLRAWLANSSHTTMAPASAPNSGRISSLRNSEVRASRSSPA